jgi:hypothetical protein
MVLTIHPLFFWGDAWQTSTVVIAAVWSKLDTVFLIGGIAGQEGLISRSFGLEVASFGGPLQTKIDGIRFFWLNTSGACYRFLLWLGQDHPDLAIQGAPKVGGQVNCERKLSSTDRDSG